MCSEKSPAGHELSRPGPALGVEITSGPITRRMSAASTELFSVRMAMSARPPPPTTGTLAVIAGSVPVSSAVVMPPREPPAE